MTFTGRNPVPPSDWTRALFRSRGLPAADQPDRPAHGTAPGGSSWAARLFQGQPPAPVVASLTILRDDAPARELELAMLRPETLIGRDPRADLRLEAPGMAPGHARLWRIDDEIHIESLDAAEGARLNRRRLRPGHPVRLGDGDQVDLPGHRLRFRLPGATGAGADDAGLEPPAATPACPLRSHLVESRSDLAPWTAGEHSLRVADIIEETADCKTFRLVGDPAMLFTYRPGQYVTLRLELDGQDLRRCYSLSSSPSRPHTLDLTVKRVPGGRVSNWLCDHLRPGDLLRVRGPAGGFSCLHHPGDRLLFIAAGSGLTPILSMCRWIMDTAAPVDARLLASFRAPADIPFRRELEWMSARGGPRVALTLTSDRRHGASWTGFTGRIDARMIELVAPDLLERRIFLCGPDAFMAAIEALLRERGFDLSRLHVESFGDARPAAAGPAPGGPTHQVRFTRSGRVAIADEHARLLDVAEAHGIAIDFSCRAGTCGECMVRCKGEVELARGCEITDAERAEGWVYACSAMARSDLEIEA